uniref:Candidate secreted effector n=1 Tax=Meloidogyne incognita TaxID=6306 RepID=A0A914KNG8_MELIC
MRNTELVQVRNIQRVESSLFQTNDASSLLNSSLPEPFYLPNNIQTDSSIWITKQHHQKSSA